MAAEDESTLITDSALVLDEESSDDGETLVQDRESHEQTQLLGEHDARAARRQAIERASFPRPLPAGGRTQPIARPADPEADPERRMLPFAMSPLVGGSPHAPMQAPVAPAARPYVAQAQPAPQATRESQRVVAPSAPPPAATRQSFAPPPPAPPPAAAQPAPRAQPPVADVPTAPLSPPPAARAAFDSAIVTQPQGTPPFVLRFLAVCGMLTAAGLAALIYLEL